MQEDDFNCCLLVFYNVYDIGNSTSDDIKHLSFKKNSLFFKNKSLKNFYISNFCYIFAAKLYRQRSV